MTLRFYFIAWQKPSQKWQKLFLPAKRLPLKSLYFKVKNKNTSTNRSISRISVRTGSTMEGANSIVTLHQLTARWRGCETTFVNILKIKNESNCFISEGRTETSAYRSGRIIKASSNDQCMVGEKMILIKQHTITPH